MARKTSVEVERKYEVGARTDMPDLHGLPGVESVDPPVHHDLTAVYFDTEDLKLARRGISLRRRMGGDDSGWHLKVPHSADGRRETHVPAHGDPDAVPEALLELVRVHLRGEAVAPVAKLSTRRTVHRLHGAGGVLAEVCDDRVRSEAGDRSGPGRWREWEIELVEGDRGLLEAGEQLFATAGAHPAGHSSKLVHALGGVPDDRGPSGAALGGGTEPAAAGPGQPASAVLLGYLHRQVGQLLVQDPMVRQDAPDSVHQMRVATRKARSALATYRKLLDRDAADQLRGELKWLAGVLGEARDAEVIRGRLAALVEAEPSELVMGPVAQRIEQELGAGYAESHQRVLAALDDPRYFALLDVLEDFLRDPPLRAKASGKPRKVVAKLVRRDLGRLRRDAAATDRDTAAGDRDTDQTGLDQTATDQPATDQPALDQTALDVALHEARKSAKRLRYAAESVIPVAGKRAERLEKAAHKIQKILGEHQDTVVTRQLLRRLGAEATGNGENGFSFGRLHALEQGAAERSEERFRRTWSKFRRKRLKG